jgi:hypothetical protein
MHHVVKQIQGRLAGNPQSSVVTLLLTLSASALAIGVALLLWNY